MTYVDWFNHRRLHGEITDDAAYTTPAKPKPPTTVKQRQPPGLSPNSHSSHAVARGRSRRCQAAIPRPRTTITQLYGMAGRCHPATLLPGAAVIPVDSSDGGGFGDAGAPESTVARRRGRARRRAGTSRRRRQPSSSVTGQSRSASPSLSQCLGSCGSRSSARSSSTAEIRRLLDRSHRRMSGDGDVVETRSSDVRVARRSIWTTMTTGRGLRRCREVSTTTYDEYDEYDETTGSTMSTPDTGRVPRRRTPLIVGYVVGLIIAWLTAMGLLVIRPALTDDEASGRPPITATTSATTEVRPRQTPMSRTKRSHRSRGSDGAHHLHGRAADYSRQTTDRRRPRQPATTDGGDHRTGDHRTADHRARRPREPAEVTTTEPATTDRRPTDRRPPSWRPPNRRPPNLTTTEPATTEPATTEPATTEPATTEPATTEPATTEPATTEPATTERGDHRTRRPRTDPGRRASDHHDDRHVDHDDHHVDDVAADDDLDDHYVDDVAADDDLDDHYVDDVAADDVDLDDHYVDDVAADDVTTTTTTLPPTTTSTTLPPTTSTTSTTLPPTTTTTLPPTTTLARRRCPGHDDDASGHDEHASRRPSGRRHPHVLRRSGHPDRGGTEQ